jgi:superfamily I DNA/RNA helicase
MKDIWISNYEEQKRKMRSLHTILCDYGGNFSEDEFEDDLPKFLKSLTEDDLNNIISNIDSNLVSKDAAKYKFYTIHAYKGLEDEHVRIADDIEDKLGDDKNLYYVALTRGMKTIVEDLPALPIMPFIEKKIVIPKTGSLIWWN